MSIERFSEHPSIPVELYGTREVLRHMFVLNIRYSLYCCLFDASSAVPIQHANVRSTFNL